MSKDFVTLGYYKIGHSETDRTNISPSVPSPLPSPDPKPTTPLRLSFEMYSRFFPLVFIFTLVVSIFAAPLSAPAAVSELAPEARSVTEELESRGFSLLEARATSGKATFYNPSVGTGACGGRNKDSELVVALGPSKYAGGKKCGKFVTVKSGSKSVRAKIVDLCPSCGSNNLDLSPAAFKKLGPLSKGVLKVSWNFS